MQIGLFFRKQILVFLDAGTPNDFCTT